MNARTEARDALLARAGWADATIAPLAGDASNRRYERVTLHDRSAVLMDAPPDKGEDVRPFVRIARYLTGNGLSAPRILAADEDAGFLLIEDLGDALFARVISDEPALERPLYEAAVDVLCTINQLKSPVSETYSSPVTVPLAALAFDWYQFGAEGRVDDAGRLEFIYAFTGPVAAFDDQMTMLIQRDYHAENLLWLPGRTGPARVGLLDFQDAMSGHPAYDLVSVLKDARRDVSPAIEEAMIRRFIDNTGFEEDIFRRAYAVFGAQRNLRILGVFARLCLRDGKAHYVDLIPRVRAHVDACLEHPELHHVRQIVSRCLPMPASGVLKRLKEQCATCPDR